MSTITLDTNGVKSLQFDANPSVEWINRNGSSWQLDGEMRPPGVFNTYVSPTSKTLVSPGQIHYVYPNWDLVFNAVANSDGSISISGVMTNNSASPLVAQINLCKLNFPHGPYNLNSSTAAPFPYTVNCADAPGYVAFEVATTPGAEVFMWEDQLGMDGVISLASPNWGGYTLSVTGDAGNPTPAGGQFTFNFKFQILGSDAAESTSVQNLATIFSIDHPQLVYWYDRRPIGQLFFTGSGIQQAQYNGVNPRNWFNDQSGNTTPANAGPKLVARAQAAVNTLTANGRSYQGMILWDSEGAQGPQGPNIYWGDIRLLRAADNPFGANFAPEMDAVLDQIIQIICGAGLKIGFCLRMNTVAKFSQYPTNAWYPYIQNPFADSATAIADLAARVLYCQQRVENAGAAIGQHGWGKQYCRLFYVDSAGQAPAGIGGNGLNNYGIWKSLQQQFPNCFFAPEGNTIIDAAFASWYSENRGGSNGPSTIALECYPQCFTLLNLANYNASSRAAVLAAWVAGNIIPMVGCWYQSPEMVYLDGITVDAKNAGWTGFQITQKQSMSLLTDIENAQTASANATAAVSQATTDIAAVAAAAVATLSAASSVATSSAKLAADATQLATDQQALQNATSALQAAVAALNTTAESTDLTSATAALATATTSLGATRTDLGA